MIELLKNKNIVVLGASSGIGFAIAKFAAEQGANVVLGARRLDKLQSNLSALKGNGIYDCFQVDASNEKQVESFISSSVNRFGPLDGVVHCVGRHDFIPISLSSSESFSKIFDTNVKSAQLVTKYATKKKSNYNREGMSVVFISSSAANRGSAGASLYSSSKAAIEGMCRSLAIEFASRKVRFNCVAPGMVETDISENMQKMLGEENYQKIISSHPLGLGKPEDVAYIASFLVSDFSSWITGSTFQVDGGFSA